RRVCITGLGCVTPIGLGRENFWRALQAGTSGVRRIESFDVSDAPVQIAAEVRDFDWAAELNPKDRRHVARTVPLALAAARGALEDANLQTSDFDLAERRATGVIIGTGGGGLAFTEQQYRYYFTGEAGRASVYTIPASTHGGLSSELSMALGEGAWVFVLEEYERALKRGAHISAEITGYGATCDAYHRVRLADDGTEPARAMQLALADAGRTAADVDYVNLHGTSTVLNDRIETRAMKLALGTHAYSIPMSATKSQVGHPQGASGAAGLAAALCAINTNLVPPTINLDEP